MVRLPTTLCPSTLYSLSARTEAGGGGGVRRLRSLLISERSQSTYSLEESGKPRGGTASIFASMENAVTATSNGPSSGHPEGLGSAWLPEVLEQAFHTALSAQPQGGGPTAPILQM